MKTLIRWTWLPLFLFTCVTSRVSAQQFSPTEDLNMTPEKTTEVLKTHWTVLRDLTAEYFKSVEQRGEFETTEEFNFRSLREREAYSAKVEAHIKEHKINKRMFGVLLKARLVSYDANTGVYDITCDTSVEFPYDIPNLITTIAPNDFVGLTDTTRGGYRMSKLYLTFDPVFKWSVDRSIAMDAKSSEGNLFFKFRFVLDLSQRNIMDKAVIRVLPVDIQLVDQNQRRFFWKQNLR